MNKFSEWWNYYQTEITWFIIGWLSFTFLDQLSRGHYVMALIDAGLIYLNYKLWKR